MKPFGRAVSSTRAGGAAAAAAAASSLLLPLLRPPFGLPRRIQHSIARHAHTQAEGSHRSIAVIGAGIAGLTSALHLARHLPRHRIALYEAADRIGGWVQSERAPVQGCKGGALLEGGPRSLRPAGLPGLSMIELVCGSDWSALGFRLWRRRIPSPKCSHLTGFPPSCLSRADLLSRPRT